MTFSTGYVLDLITVVVTACLHLVPIDEMTEQYSIVDETGDLDPFTTLHSTDLPPSGKEVMEPIGDELGLALFPESTESVPTVNLEYGDDYYSGFVYQSYLDPFSWSLTSTPSYNHSRRESPWSTNSSLSSASDADSQVRYDPGTSYLPESSPIHVLTELDPSSDSNVFNVEKLRATLQQQPHHHDYHSSPFQSSTPPLAFSSSRYSPGTSSTFLTPPTHLFPTRPDHDNDSQRVFKQEYANEPPQFLLPTSTQSAPRGAHTYAPVAASRILGSPSTRHSPYLSPNASPGKRHHKMMQDPGVSLRSDADEPVGLGLEIAGAYTLPQETDEHMQPEPDMGGGAMVSKQHVTSAPVASASERRRRHKAPYTCPIPDCGTTFTRRFNLRGACSCCGHAWVVFCLNSLTACEQDI